MAKAKYSDAQLLHLLRTGQKVLALFARHKITARADQDAAVRMARFEADTRATRRKIHG
jgi:hypothetical protein